MRLMILSLLALPLAAQTKNPAWQLQESGTTAGLRGIHAVSEQVAWASGSGGTILRTTDGGQHWQPCATPDAKTDGATLDFRGIQAWDEKTAIVMASGPGEKSRLYRTTDGCKTWLLAVKNEDKNGFWDALRMWTPTDGCLAGDPVDGYLYFAEARKYLGQAVNGGFFDDIGRNLMKVTAKGEAAFAASNSSIALGNFNQKTGTARSVWFATGGTAGSRVIRYQHFNGGEPEVIKFTEAKIPGFPASEAGGIFAIWFINDLRGIAVGGDYTKPDETAGTAAYSLDAGEHWTAAEKPPHGYRSTVQWSEALKVWIAAGPNGSDLSRDDGRTWQAVDQGAWNALSLPFIVGPQGRIARLNAAALDANK